MASPASRIAKARWTTTSAPFTSAAHAGRVGHVALAVLGLLPAGSAGVEGPARHAHDPLDAARALERETIAMPRSPVGPVTATVRPSGGMRLVGVAGFAREHDACHAAVHEHARLHRLDPARARVVERLLDRVELGQLLEVLDGREHEQQLVAARTPRVRRAG